MPAGGPPWSAWQRHIERLRENRARTCRHYRKYLESCKAALGPQLPVWRPRPGKSCDGRIARQYKGKYTVDMTTDERIAAWIGACEASKPN